MDSTVSVSKGCFVFNNKPRNHKKGKKKKKHFSHIEPLYSEPWYAAYKKCWKSVGDKIEALHQQEFSKMFHDLVGYVKTCHTNSKLKNIIPAVTLLTGVNMPDHAALFLTLSDKLKSEVTPYVTTLHAHDCGSIRLAVEQMVSQFVNISDSYDEDSDEDMIQRKVKKSHCNFPALLSWYKSITDSSDSLDSDTLCDDSFDEQTSQKDVPYRLKNSKRDVSSQNNKTKSSPLKTQIKSSSSFIKGLYSPGKSPRKFAIAKKIVSRSPNKRLFENSTVLTSKKNLESSNLSPSDQDVLDKPSTTSIRTPKSSDHLQNAYLDELDEKNYYTPQKRVASNNSSPSKPPYKKLKFDNDTSSDSEKQNKPQRTTRKKNSSSSKVSKTKNCSEIKLNDKRNKPYLIVVLPDFESFSSSVIQDLILIASGYIMNLPLVFVFGVATTVTAVHRSLPYHVSSKVSIQVFHSQSSTDLLNIVVDKVLLSSDCPFHLGDKTFQLLIDIFLFYDFSVHGFIQGFKFCMLEHFSSGSYTALCCNLARLKENIASLNEDDLESLRSLGSFRKYVESRPKTEKVPLLTDDKFLTATLVKLMKQFHQYLFNFHVMLRCLKSLTATLPKAPLGKQSVVCLSTELRVLGLIPGMDEKCIIVEMPAYPFTLREMYSLAVNSDLSKTKEFKNCSQLLSFQSRDELLGRLEQVVSVLSHETNVNLAAQVDTTELEEVTERIMLFSVDLQQVGLEPRSPIKSPKKASLATGISRLQFKEKLLEMTHTEQPLSAFEILRKNVLQYLMEEVFPKFLGPPSKLPLHEVMFFDEPSSLKRHVAPSLRSAIHMALNDPHYYLQCECCKLSDSSTILPSLPDICVVYKLHLECGRLINLYDWLQAFLTVVSPSETGEEQREVDPHMQGMQSPKDCLKHYNYRCNTVSFTKNFIKKGHGAHKLYLARLEDEKRIEAEQEDKEKINTRHYKGPRPNHGSHVLGHAQMQISLVLSGTPPPLNAPDRDLTLISSPSAV
uniref:Origin recognition complex subunit 3 n=1 Tax=Timema poppense TaxID=170557 RepID=A0A7R9CWC7_TIMPO|nr:unnamed protein product [Timema poppensis]